VIVGVVWLAAYFLRKGAYLRFVASDWIPDRALWRRLLAIGLPAGAEFALMGVYLVIVYTISKPFGAAAQAGFGIGMRIMQAGFMPVVALAFAVAPVAGQNFAAHKAARVRETFTAALRMAVGVMLAFAVLCHIAPGAMIGFFNRDPEVVAVGDEYLRILSWNFVPAAVVFVASSMFQAIGNTIPPLVSSIVRLLIVVIPASALARLPGFQLRWIWYLAVGAACVQMVLNLLLLQRELRRRLDVEVPLAGSQLSGA
jgi:MATE family, multidrug efflux pump